MSDVDENEDGSDEDMFSPKKNHCKIETSVVEPVNRLPGCKARFVNTFKRMLAGVPPPPDYTNPDFHLDKMLTNWKENQNLVWGQGSTNTRGSSEEGQSTLGICLNTDDSCEELELLGRQICERYIWSETSAVTSCVYVKLTQSAKKRRKANGWGLSPRTRISYLTRRMTTFQKNNIAAAVASTKTTQILIAKNDGKKESAGKCDFKGKRALFQSPETQNKYRTPEQGKDKKLVRRLLLNSSPQGSDKSRYNSGGESAKSSEKRRCSRSLFSTKTEQVSDQTSMPQNQSQKSNALSTQHRQKMLWAVSNALKSVKIRMTDSEFRTYAGPLFKATTEKWRASLNSSAGDKKSSTSDAMLVAAKSLVEGITGRKMSPKSAKKNPTLRMRIKTPDKSGKRDENNPPSVANPVSPIISLKKYTGDAGVFPLEHVGVLAEKLDPRENSHSFSFQNTSPTRKRKLEDESDTHNQSTSILVSPRALRMRTPSKTNGLTPKKLTFHPSVVDGTPSKQSNDSPLAKKRKLASSSTPTKSKNADVEKIVLVSPRVLRTRTPSKIPESPEVQRVTPKKMRSTPSKQPSLLKNVENCGDGAQTPKSHEEMKGILISPRVQLTKTPSRVAPSSEVCTTQQTPKKVLFAPVDEKCGDRSSQQNLSKPLQLANETRIPDLVSIECGGRVLRSTPSRLGESASAKTTPGSRRLSTERRMSLTPQKVPFADFSPSSNNDKSMGFQTDVGYREAKKVTSRAKKTARASIQSGDEDTADSQPPALRPENVSLRRSSRRCSAELPPPVLKMEIPDTSLPLLTPEKR